MIKINNYFTQFATQGMKKPNMKPQQSCAELPKYKFIPPNKLMKARNPHHFQSLIESNSMATNQSFADHDQPGITNCSKKQVNCAHMDNAKANNKKQDALVRSISNPKLQTSNSRNAILTQKTQPCESYKHQQFYFDKLSQFIQEFQDKEFAKNSEIASLRQQNKELNLKLQKANSALAQKNKQNIELASKNQQLEGEIREKNQQHSLIIDSLKKIIESQVQKINQMKAKMAKLQKGKYSSQRIENKGAEELTFEINDSFPSEVDEFSSPEYKQSVGKNERKCKNFLKFIRNSLSQENCGQQEEAENCEQISMKSLEGSREDMTKRKTPTPDFGARTPTSDDDKISIHSSLEQDHANLTLSRISQSVEEDFETSRENSGLENSPQGDKENCHKISTHQQLLDQIDQYLSKKTNFMPKG